MINSLDRSFQYIYIRLALINASLPNYIFAQTSSYIQISVVYKEATLDRII